MILASSVVGALQVAYHFWQEGEFPQARRMIIGLGLLLTIRLILFFAAGLTTQGLIDPRTILPILDRLATTYGLIIIIWLWVFPESTSVADISTILIGLLTLIFAVLSWIWWQGLSINYYFNAVWFDIGWSIYALIIIGLGILFLATRQTQGWGYGLSILLLAALGQIFHISFPISENDFAGTVRLAQIAAYPMLLSLPRRFSSSERSEKAASVRTPVQSHPNYGIEPNRLEPLLNMIAETAQPKLFKSFTSAVAEIMFAEVVLFFSMPSESDQYTFHCGYDLISQEALEGMSIGQDKLPMISSAMEQSQSLRLPANSISPDLINLRTRLNLGKKGHLLAAFLPSQKDLPLWGIVALSPYSNRRWSKEDQIYLEKIAESLAVILDRNKLWEMLQDELDTTQYNLHDFQARSDEIQMEKSEIDEELEQKNSLMLEQQSMINELEAVHLKSQGTIDELQAENIHLSEMVETLTMGNDQSTSTLQEEGVKQELDLAVEEIYRLNQKLDELEKDSGLDNGKLLEGLILSENQIDVFSSIAKDLRQPMSSIVGYTDLLLDESAGILGALQRKFLERVSSSTERMEILLDDLIKVTVLDGEQFPIKPEAVTLGFVIDKAVADTSEQMREKQITLRVDLPHQMPSIHADRDALQQILIHLLKNASAVSPKEGEISLHARVHDVESDQQFVLVQIADQGGGMSKEDLSRVFSRKYRADNASVKGIGDTGVGLSIVKALVEAQNGRVWVDTEENVGSTFSLLLPLANGSTPQEGD
ncbi:MAG: ATP-binding protein [Chloroflexota bacterium]